MTGATIVSTGCSVARDQQTVGSYVDDAAITTAVKAKMAEDKAGVSAAAISVETLNGTVQLSGFAKSQPRGPRRVHRAQHQACARRAQQHRRAALM